MSVLVLDAPHPTVEISAGGVVFRRTEDGPRYLLILDAHGNWGFPKGHVDEGESGSAAAQREITEETGLRELALHAPLGTIDWHFEQGGRPVHKFCHFYLFEAAAEEAAPQEGEGITACAWHSAEEAQRTITFENARGLLRRAAAEVARLCRGGDDAAER
jgi:8-oxo-dGTP pyrophosphatase MutT (NUDIX family)